MVMAVPTTATSRPGHVAGSLAGSGAGSGHPGRRRVTSRDELEQTAFALFAAHGFEATTVDEIAAAAGIGRRTFFRYFPSKNDIPWGAFEAELDRMRVRLKACPAQVPLMEAIRVALIDFNQVAPAQVPLHRRRMELILRVPTLLAHSTLRFTAWRAVIAEFAAERTGDRPDDLAPQAPAHGALLDEAMCRLAAAFAGTLG